jgi:hypothetical protein
MSPCTTCTQAVTKATRKKASQTRFRATAHPGSTEAAIVPDPRHTPAWRARNGLYRDPGPIRCRAGRARPGGGAGPAQKPRPDSREARWR